MMKNLQMVIFTVRKELYGVGVDSIHEIVRVPDVTEVPEAPVFLEGVINLRGRVVPVIDLRKRLRLEGAEKTKFTRVLITGNGRGTVGLIVDSVSEVVKIQPDAVEDPPEMVSAIGVEYIAGVAKVDEKLIILLDIKKILDTEDMRRAVTLLKHITPEMSLEEDSGKKVLEKVIK